MIRHKGTFSRTLNIDYPSWGGREGGIAISDKGRKDGRKEDWREGEGELEEGEGATEGGREGGKVIVELILFVIP